jgi:prolyl oligopeptidase
LLVDPDRFVTAPGTHYSLNYFVPSYDGRYVAYGVSPGGSEDAVIHILDVASGRDTGETIDRSWYGGIAWLPDNRSFVHIRFQKLGAGADPKERRLKTRVYLHRVGTDAESDVAVFGYGVVPGIDLDPSDSSALITDPRSKFALATVNRGFANENTIYLTTVESIGKPDVQWKKICGPEEAVTSFDLRGDDLFLVTHKDAPRFKVIRTSFSHPDLATAALVVPQGEAVIQNVVAAPDALYVQELDGGVGRLLRASYSGGSSQFASMPVNGTLWLFGGDPRLRGLLLGITSFTKAYRVYLYDSDTKGVTDTGLQPRSPFDDPATSKPTRSRSAAMTERWSPSRSFPKKGSNSTAPIPHFSPVMEHMPSTWTNTTTQPGWRGWSVEACSRSLMFAAAANTGKHGTRPR